MNKVRSRKCYRSVVSLQTVRQDTVKIWDALMSSLKNFNCLWKIFWLHVHPNWLIPGALSFNVPLKDHQLTAWEDLLPTWRCGEVSSALSSRPSLCRLDWRMVSTWREMVKRVEMVKAEKIQETFGFFWMVCPSFFIQIMQWGLRDGDEWVTEGGRGIRWIQKMINELDLIDPWA